MYFSRDVDYRRYEQFVAWTRQVLSRHDHARYSDAAGMPVPSAGSAPLPLLRDVSRGQVAVLASHYRRALAGSRGILVTRSGHFPGAPRRVQALVEKPSLAEAAELEEAYGPENLRMLEGRARLTLKFLDFARDRQHAESGSEPRLALTIGAYAREHPVVAISGGDDVIDLGAPKSAASRQTLRDLATG